MLAGRKQVMHGNAEVYQVGNFFDEACIGAPPAGLNARSGAFGKTAHVHFVNDGTVKRGTRVGIVFPIVSAGIGNHTFQAGYPACCS